MIRENKLKEFEEQVKQNFRWNFTVNAVDFALYIFALSFASILTILPAFVSKFTTSNVVIGMIPAINVIGWLMPQLAAAKYVEKFDRKKRFVVIVGIWERLPWLLVAVAIILLHNSRPFWILSAFFSCYAIFCFAGGINTPPWLDMIGKIIPENKRGLFFGVSNFIGSGFGVAGALFAGYLLENLAVPWNFAICFACSFVSMTISLVFVGLTRETAYPIVKEKSSLNAYLKQLKIICKTNRNFLFFLIGVIFISFSSMASGFFTVHAISKLKLTGEDIGRFTAITMFFQTISNPLWGQWGDRGGHKNVMAAGAAGIALMIREDCSEDWAKRHCDAFQNAGATL
jgi:MFS family permease